MRSYRVGIAGMWMARSDAAATGGGDGVTTVWKCPLPAGGILQVVDVDVVFKQDSAVSDEAYRLRAVRLGHSIMGGEWTAPASVAGLPIFSAFHLQAAAGALFSSATRNSRDEGMKKTDDPDIADPLGPPNARDRPTRALAPHRPGHRRVGHVSTEIGLRLRLH